MENSQYIVNDQTKKLWQIELDMAKVLLELCGSFKLKIWACFGTLLGAVRHGGFIPWDDDMDFVMMRPDYDKLLQLIESHSLQLPTGLSFDTKDISVIKLFCSSTTMINPYRCWSKDNKHGVWVDVFCLDVAPDDIMQKTVNYAKRKRRVRMYSNFAVGYYAMVRNPHYWLGHFAMRWYFRIFSEKCFRERLEHEFRQDKIRFSGSKVWPFLIWSHVRTIERIPRYERSWFDDTVMLPFEDCELPCPSGWNALLNEQYGDWHTPIIGESLHEGIVLDLERPFNIVLEEKLNSMPAWKRYFFKH